VNLIQDEMMPNLNVTMDIDELEITHEIEGGIKEQATFVASLGRSIIDIIRELRSETGSTIKVGPIYPHYQHYYYPHQNPLKPTTD